MRKSAVWPRCTGSSVPPSMPIFLCSIFLLYTICARVKSGFVPVGCGMDGAFWGKICQGGMHDGQNDRPRGAACAGGAGRCICSSSRRLAISGWRRAAPCAALLLLRKLLLPLAGRLPKREASRGRARAEVERWAMLDAGAAEAEARALLEKAYPGQAAEAELVFLPRHPQGPPLDVNAVLDAWRGAGRGKAAAGHHGAGGRGGARLRGKARPSRRVPDRRRAAVRAA